MEISMKDQTVIVFGGGSGIGEATALEARRAGAEVVIVGRERTQLDEAARRIGGARAAVADATDSAAVARVFSELGKVDHVVIGVSGSKGAGLLSDLDFEQLQQAFAEKTIAQLRVAQAAARSVRAGGSITFISAASARSVIRGTAGLAAVNGAIEAVVPILAVELQPIRVNAVSPGIIDTAWWSRVPAEAKAALFRSAEANLPVHRVGRPEEVAKTLLLLMQSGFVTGSIYEVDGGSHLVTQ
jgi:NAD(P)-dependent dehydrogenase (short-subunit alcohol dehydrogenase family)